MNEPVNILYIIDSLDFGGTERQLTEMIKHLDRSRFQPHLCTLKESDTLYAELEIPKIFLDFISFYHPSILNNLTCLSHYIRKNRIRIIQTFFTDPFLLAAIASLFKKIKLIGSFRDLGFWRNSVSTWKMRYSYPFFSGFIANSESVKNHFVSMDGINADKVKVIYNGFDISVINNCLDDCDTNERDLVGIVANLNRPVKRVNDFIEAAALIYKKKPDTRFVIVGDGHLRGELERLAESRGLMNALVFTGRITNPLEFVRNFDVGVISSESEGLCNAIIEYMACGVPVVATAVGGNPELIREGENGFLVDVGDIKLMAARIELLLHDRNLHNKMRRANVARISRDFSIQQMVAGHESYYDRILGTELCS